MSLLTSFEHRLLFSAKPWRFSLFFGLAFSLYMGVAQPVCSQTQAFQYQWSAPQNISDTPDASWFPDLAIDSYENVHVIWCETSLATGGLGIGETVFYKVKIADVWSEANDLVPANPDIARNAIAIDQSDNIYLAFRYGTRLYVKWAYADAAWSAKSWSTPHRVDHRGNTYLADLDIDSDGAIHLVYDDRGDPDSPLCSGGCADLYYRSSADQGRTWTYPRNLSESPAGEARGQIEIDQQDVIHVTWDEGWDRLSGIGNPRAGGYSFSKDGGKSWSPMLSITHPDSTVAQLAVGSDNQGGVILVWRTTSSNLMYYQWSDDGGETWGRPEEISGIWARPWTIPFDLYDMATDSSGQIHLLAVGREAPERDAPLGVYHLVWDGKAWSAPTNLYSVPGYFPEYPRIVIHEGNQLHAIWFSREGSEYDQMVNREVWYSLGRSSAPRVEVTPVPTPTSPPPTSTPSPNATATPFPTMSFQGSGPPMGLDSETDDISRLLIALLPVAALTAGVFLFTKRAWLRRIKR